MSDAAAEKSIGISGLSVYVPPLRVNLEEWCRWNDQDWNKTRHVVGHSFRQKPHWEDVYTMGANAALQLIRQHDIDPSSIGWLALATESSTDNSAGPVIIRGMLDEALTAAGLPALAGDCEVPEFKQACLAGVYALKAAARWLNYDGAGRRALVICADIAEYERGSSGEPTQGAGAVAMLVEENPRLCRLQLRDTGAHSAYRGIDFRKPTARFFHQQPGYPDWQHDYPVFNGRYSTWCFMDATRNAVDNLLQKQDTDLPALLAGLQGILMHRPYEMMPVQALSFIVAAAAARRPELFRDILTTPVPEAARAEAVADHRACFTRAVNGEEPDNPFPALTALARDIRSGDWFRNLLATRMHRGNGLMKEMGNLYSAALPACIAAALQESLDQGEDLSGARFLLVGYGSGDAADAFFMEVVPGWEEAAGRIGFRAALAGATDLDRRTYEDLHDRRGNVSLPSDHEGFVITATGRRHQGDLQDIGIDYYRWLSPNS